MAKENRKNYAIDSEKARVLGRLTLDVEEEIGKKAYKQGVLETLIDCAADDEVVFNKVTKRLADNNS